MAKLKPKEMFTVAGRTYTVTRVNNRYCTCDVCTRVNTTRPCEVNSYFFDVTDCAIVLRKHCYPKATKK